MTESGTVWILSPSYFDVPSWRRLRAEIDAVLAQTQLLAKYVLVDDSAGADPEVASLESDSVKLITMPFNVGHQRALTYGLRRVLPSVDPEDLVVTMDADGEDQPEDVPKLVGRLDGRFQVCLARRRKRRERLGFRLGYILFRVLFRALTGRSMRTGNFAAMTALTARRLLLQPEFDLSYASALTISGADIVLVDCDRGARYAGVPKMDRQRLVSHGLRSLMPFQEQIAIRALFASTVVALSALTSVVVIAAVRLGTDRAIPGWATYSSLILIAISLVAISNFVIMFALLSQSRGIALSGLERDFE